MRQHRKNFLMTLRSPRDARSFHEVKSNLVQRLVSKNVTRGVDFEMEGISSYFEGLPRDTQQREGFGNRSIKGSFGAGPKDKLKFSSGSGEFNLKSAD